MPSRTINNKLLLLFSSLFASSNAYLHAMVCFSIHKYIVSNDLGREICMTSQAKDEQCGIAVDMK